MSSQGKVRSTNLAQEKASEKLETVEQPLFQPVRLEGQETPVPTQAEGRVRQTDRAASCWRPSHLLLPRLTLVQSFWKAMWQCKYPVSHKHVCPLAQ